VHISEFVSTNAKAFLKKGFRTNTDQFEIVEEEIARELEGIKGVAAAKVKGGFEKEILIKVDEKKQEEKS